MAKESKHALFLRELGFEPYSEEAEAYIADRKERRLVQTGALQLMQKLNRANRRMLKKLTRIPTFGFMPSSEKTLVVTDETGRHWTPQKEIDVSALKRRGFQDITEEFALTAAANLLPPPPRRNN